MKRHLIDLETEKYPETFHSFLSGATLYDSSCSKEAQVLFIDKDNGYFLKSAPKGALKTEAELTQFFCKKQLSAPVLAYISEDKDFLLTERIVGEDCTHEKYLENPEKLCDIMAEKLYLLHNTDYSGCPVQNRTESYIEAVTRGYSLGKYDNSLFPNNYGFSSAESAWNFFNEHKHLLKNDTLLHGDYCLPNIILDDWKFSGFIDLGNGGVGDKHIDLFWGAWTLFYNLKTDKYSNRFFDCYGRENINMDMLSLISAAETFG